MILAAPHPRPAALRSRQTTSVPESSISARRFIRTKGALNQVETLHRRLQIQRRRRERGSHKYSCSFKLTMQAAAETSPRAQTPRTDEGHTHRDGHPRQPAARRPHSFTPRRTARRTIARICTSIYTRTRHQTHCIRNPARPPIAPTQSTPRVLNRDDHPRENGNHRTA
jgi:hypothetical protein